MTTPIVKKLREIKEPEIVTLDTGVRVIIEGVSHFELQELSMLDSTPKPPRVLDHETGREIENEADPDYQAALQDSNLKRGLRVLDAMLIGVKLVDGLPEDESWIKRLRFKEKKGLISLDGLDLDDELEREYAFKKYVAFKSSNDWLILQGKVRAVKEAADQADAMFPGDEASAADSRLSTEEGIEG